MAGRGPAPKDAERRQRRNADPTPATTLTEKRLPAPELPNRNELQPSTRRWWDTWVESAQARSFTSTDWEALRMIVPLVDSYWKHVAIGEPAKATALAGEIRLQQAKLGFTPEDRARLRMTVELEDDEPPKATRARRKDPRLEVIEGGKSKPKAGGRARARS